MACCYGGYNNGGYFCNGEPESPTMAPTNAPTKAPTMPVELSPVAPYTVGAYSTNVCAANSAPIPTNVYHMCNAAAITLELGVATGITGETLASAPKGCVTKYDNGLRSYAYNIHATGSASAVFQTICASDYAYSPEWMNTCPMVLGSKHLYLRIANLVHCNTANAALGLGAVPGVYATARPQSSFQHLHPKGCFFRYKAASTDMGVYHNMHASGASDGDDYPICAASDFSLGVLSANNCPSGKHPIAGVDMCAAFAIAAGRSFDTAIDGRANGCHLQFGGTSVGFNPLADGIGEPSTQTVCTSVYTYAQQGVNGCAGVGDDITTLQQCQEAADALGLRGGAATGEVDQAFNSNFHKRCHVDSFVAHEVSFNTHATGGALSYHTTICV